MTLDSLGVLYGTDKSSIHHNYLYRYEPYFAGLPTAPDILEIGVHKGASIRVWLDYFPESWVTGIDISAFDLEPITNDRFTFILGDGTDQDVWDELGMFDLVIDDGSHIAREVMDAFRAGFLHVRQGGLWIIEDVDVAYYEQWGRPSIIDLLREVIDELNDWGRGLTGDPRQDHNEIEYVHFLKSLVIIKKR